MEGEWLFKGSLVGLTTKLVSVSGLQSLIRTALTPDGQGVIRRSHGPGHPAHRGEFDLAGKRSLSVRGHGPVSSSLFHSPPADHRWQASLYNAESLYQPSPDKGLIRLLPGLLHMVSENLDLLEQSLPLLDSYLLLDGAGIFQVGEAKRSLGPDSRRTARTSAKPWCRHFTSVPRTATRSAGPKQLCHCSPVLSRCRHWRR